MDLVAQGTAEPGFCKAQVPRGSVLPDLDAAVSLQIPGREGRAGLDQLFDHRQRLAGGAAVGDDPVGLANGGLEGADRDRRDPLRGDELVVVEGDDEATGLVGKFLLGVSQDVGRAAAVEDDEHIVHLLRDCGLAGRAPVGQRRNSVPSI